MIMICNFKTSFYIIFSQEGVLSISEHVSIQHDREDTFARCLHFNAFRKNKCLFFWNASEVRYALFVTLS